MAFPEPSKPIQLPPPSPGAGNWKATGNSIGQRILGRLGTTFKWEGTNYPCVYGESELAEDVFGLGGGTNESGTIRFSTLKSNFKGDGKWPQKNDFVDICGTQYQVNTLAGDTDTAHPWLIYKVELTP